MRRFVIVLVVLASLVWAVPVVAEEPPQLEFGVIFWEEVNTLPFEGSDGWLYVADGMDGGMVGDATISRIAHPREGARIRVVLPLWFDGEVSKLRLRGTRIGTRVYGHPYSGDGLLCTDYKVRWELSDRDLSDALVERGYAPIRWRGRGEFYHCLRFRPGEDTVDLSMDFWTLLRYKPQTPD